MPKPKLFICTGCDNKVDHVTTHHVKDGTKYVFKNQKLCDTCLRKQKKAVDEFIASHKHESNVA